MSNFDMIFFVVTLTFVQIWLFRIYNLLDKRLPQEKTEKTND